MNTQLTHSPDLDSFDHDDAWRIGTALVTRCGSEDLLVTTVIAADLEGTPPPKVRYRSGSMARWSV